jgi:hypothetical protein
MIKALVFDWGDTLMRDYPEYSGSMAFWPKVELMPYVDEALKAVGNMYTCYAASNAGASDLVLMGKAFERVGIMITSNINSLQRSLASRSRNCSFTVRLSKGRA